MSRRGPYARHDDPSDIWQEPVSRDLLMALNEAHTVGEVMAAIQWDRNRIRSWIKYLRRTGRVVLKGYIWTEPPRRLAGVYQRVKTRPQECR